MTARPKRKSSQPPPSIAPELLAHLETVLEHGQYAGQVEAKIQPAHRRLRANGKIEPEAEAAVTELCREILRAETGYCDPGNGTGDGNIVTAQMLAGDAVRSFERDYGRGAVLLIALACIECWRGAWVAHRLLKFRAPRNHATPSESWHDEGRRVLDKALIPLFAKMGERAKPLDTTRRIVSLVPSSPELGKARSASIHGNCA